MDEIEKWVTEQNCHWNESLNNVAWLIRFKYKLQAGKLFQNLV